LRHPSADNLPSGEIAWTVGHLSAIAVIGVELLPDLKTGIRSHDSTDAELIKIIHDELTEWTGLRAAFGVSESVTPFGLSR